MASNNSTPASTRAQQPLRDLRDEDQWLDDTPLHLVQPFGKGLFRHGISFVPASSGDLATTVESDKSHGQTVSQLYLSKVLKKPQDSETHRSASAPPAPPSGITKVCEVCKAAIEPTSAVASDPTERSHEASLVHQVCLPHSHPPSALDRGRMGLVVLESQGWDPDARKGLGAAGQGVAFPIKAQPKTDTHGIGVVVPRGFGKTKAAEKPKLLDAGKVRKQHAIDKKRTEKLQQEIFGRAELDRYLGSGA